MLLTKVDSPTSIELMRSVFGKALIKGFIPWLNQINVELDLCASDSELDTLETALQQIFSERPMRFKQGS